MVYLGDDEHVLSPDLPGREPRLQRATDDVLVLVVERRVDVAIAHLEGSVQGLLQLVLLPLNILHRHGSRDILTYMFGI
jgi:hypothetical protein